MRFALGLSIGLLLAIRVAAADGPAPPESTIEQLLDAIAAKYDPSSPAIKELVKRRSAEVVPAARTRLASETHFHERNALAFVLASHGEKAGVAVLIDSLSQTGHFGWIFLTDATQENFGWGTDGAGQAQWRAWLATFTEEEYRRRVARRRLTPSEAVAGWDAFDAAARFLAAGGDRAEAGAKFGDVATRFPISLAADDARELATLLAAQAKEDTKWERPAAVGSLPLDRRLEALTFRLRSARGRYSRMRDAVSFLAVSGSSAEALFSEGAAAIPTLLALLEDRRPTRAIDPGLADRGKRAVLRIQDAALEILNALLPPVLYDRPETASYLSAESRGDREKTIADVRAWAKDTAGKSPREIVWLGIRRMETKKALFALRRLALDGEKAAVLEELARMFDGARPFVWQPSICEVMAELGDTSRVATVVEGLEAEKYFNAPSDQPGREQHDVARRVRAKYGSVAPAK